MKKYILITLLLSFSSIANAGLFEEKMCTVKTVRDGICKKGDALFIRTGFAAAKYCDMSEVISLGGDDERATGVCIYSGYERKLREK